MINSSMIFFAIAQLLGGLAIFVYGMFVSSDSLQKSAGRKMKTLLYRLTKNRLSGFGIGTALSFLIHSGPVMVMAVGFVNAGLLNFAESIAVMIGANVGTTLSMQLLSFDIGKYAFLAIGIGYLLSLTTKSVSLKNFYLIIFGFGLIFLGIVTMTSAVGPLKDAGYFTAVVQHLGGETIFSMLLAILVSALCTTIMQSSGAMIGIIFALSSAGVFTNFNQIFPMVLGAHIGTCTTALLGSIGTHVSAKRAAMAHLMFNVLGAVAALIMFKFYAFIIPYSTSDLVHQVANTHTLVQLVNGLLLLPFVRPFAYFIIKLIPSKSIDAEKSYLDETLLDTPEQAIVATLNELKRMAKISRDMLQRSMKGLLHLDFSHFVYVRKQEEVVDTLKTTINNYLMLIAERKLSRRQSIIIQYLATATNDLERIGDHIDSLASLTEEKTKNNIWFDDGSMMDLMELYKKADTIMMLIKKSFEPSFYQAPGVLSNEILEERNRFVTLSNTVRARYNERILNQKENALNGMFFNKYLVCFNKLVKHSKTIAVVEMEPFFFIKRHKLSKKSEYLGPRAKVVGQRTGVYDEEVRKRLEDEDEPV